MSRLDSLLSMVDNITDRTDTLVNSFSESSNLASVIVDISSSITGSEVKMDQMTELIQRNAAYLGEFQRLYEKSFYLESNLDMHGSFSNESSYSKIYNEYYNLWNRFESENSIDIPDSPERDPVQPLAPLRNMLSISNLNLKPLKCKSTKVSKQKSRYRLSEAYTLNPIQKNQRDVLDGSTYTTTSNIMDETSKHLDLASVSSYSDGELEHWDRELHGYSPVSTEHTQTMPNSLSSHQDDVFQAPYFDISQLPLSLKAKRVTGTKCDLDESDPDPVTCLQEDEFANFENFHLFLRKSRIDLREAFPAPKPKPKTTEELGPPSFNIPAFHNPAHMITSQSKQMATQPTVEQVYSLSFDGKLKFSEHSKKLLGPETTLDPIPAVTTPVKKQNHGLFQLLNSPLGSPRGLRLERPPQEIPSKGPPTNQTRRLSNDFMGMSLASSFLSLVGTKSPLPSNSNAEPAAPKPKGKSPPAKIKKLKRSQKDPIASNNEIRSKRLPPSDRGPKDNISASGRLKDTQSKAKDSQKPFFVRRTTLLLKDALNEAILS